MPFFKYIFSKKHRPFSGFTVYRERAEILFIFVFQIIFLYGQKTLLFVTNIFYFNIVLHPFRMYLLCAMVSVCTKGGFVQKKEMHLFKLQKGGTIYHSMVPPFPLQNRLIPFSFAVILYTNQPFCNEKSQRTPTRKYRKPPGISPGCFALCNSNLYHCFRPVCLPSAYRFRC